MKPLPVIDVTDALAVVETFTSLQGEGPSTGRRAAFVRLAGCNLRCGWCDEPRTWDARRFDLAEQSTYWEADTLVRLLATAEVGLVVITGGEPLLHQHRSGWVRLIAGLAEYGFDIEIETNGTIEPGPFTRKRARFNVSPKLAHSGMALRHRFNHDALTALVEADSVFKFVVQTPADLAEVADLANAAGLPTDRIWVMPEGTTPDRVLAVARRVADDVLARGWNLTLRQHVLLWPDEDTGR